MSAARQCTTLCGVDSSLNMDESRMEFHPPVGSPQRHLPLKRCGQMNRINDNSWQPTATRDQWH